MYFAAPGEGKTVFFLPQQHFPAPEYKYHIVFPDGPGCIFIVVLFWLNVLNHNAASFFTSINQK